MRYGPIIVVAVAPEPSAQFITRILSLELLVSSLIASLGLQADNILLFSFSMADISTFIILLILSMFKSLPSEVKVSAANINGKKVF